MKMYYITNSKTIQIKGFDIFYRATKMMVYGGLISMVCIGVNCTPIIAGIGISVLKSCCK